MLNDDAKTFLAGLEALHVGHVRGGDLPGDQLGHRQVDTGQHQERTQRDQERRDLGLHHQVAVEESDGQRHTQRQRRTEPQVQMQVVREHRRRECARRHRDTGREVELPTDHQQPDRDGHDADRRAGVQHRGQGLRAAERRGDDGEEDEDRHRADERAHLGSNQQALQLVLLFDPFVVDDLVGLEVEICLGCHRTVVTFRAAASGCRLRPARPPSRYWSCR